MIIKKITIGFVIQEFDTETNQCIHQEFIAGDEVDWEDNSGNSIDISDLYSGTDEPYCSFGMADLK